MHPRKYLAYIGTYTAGSSEGIYAMSVDAATGTMELKGLAAKVENPSYLAIDSNNRFLYTVMETDSYKDTPGGAVGAYSISPQTGELTFLNHQSTKGKIPCHISTDRSNNYLFAANYRDGTVSLFPLNEDGSLRSVSSIIKHQGSGPNKERQEQPHTHYVTLTPEENYLCAVDLGMDQIVVYRFDPTAGTLSHDAGRSVNIHPGAGPRHIDFHPSGRFAYLVNELSSDIVAMEYSPEDSALIQRQTVSSLPLGYTGSSSGAAIHISPDGNYLYASNRGHDSIAAFRIDAHTGKLEFIGHFSTLGHFPRDFSLDPSGKFLYAANQHSDSIVAYAVHPESGCLEPLGQTISVPSPVCIKFLHV